METTTSELRDSLHLLSMGAALAVDEGGMLSVVEAEKTLNEALDRLEMWELAVDQDSALATIQQKTWQRYLDAHACRSVVGDGVRGWEIGAGILVLDHTTTERVIALIAHLHNIDPVRVRFDMLWAQRGTR